VFTVLQHIYEVAFNKLLYLQWTLGDRNSFLPGILVPINCKRAHRCNIVFVEVITVHVSLAKTATASNDPIQTQPNILQVTRYKFDTAV